jgi:hypothetical protein
MYNHTKPLKPGNVQPSWRSRKSRLTNKMNTIMFEPLSPNSKKVKLDLQDLSIERKIEFPELKVGS